MVGDKTTSMHVLPIECKQFSFLKVGHTLGYGFLMLFVIHYVLYRITRERIDTANETKWKFGPFCWFVFSTVGCWPGSQRQCFKVISMTCADTEMGTTTIFERVEIRELIWKCTISSTNQPQMPKKIAIWFTYPRLQTIPRLWRAASVKILGLDSFWRS